VSTPAAGFVVQADRELLDQDAVRTGQPVDHDPVAGVQTDLDGVGTAPHLA
jgi:hypothetical protein